MFEFFGKSSEESARETAIEQESLNRRTRNEARMAKIREEMGEKWIMHPSHMKSKLDEPRPV